MPPEAARILALFRRFCNANASCGRLPAPRAARTVVEGLIWPFFPGTGTHPSRRLLLNGPSNMSRWRWWWLRPQFRDEPQNLLEHLPWDGDLGHLEGDIAAVADDLGADLDQLLLQACQRPFLNGLRRRQRAQEVAEIVGECMKLEPHRVGGE